MVGDLTMDSAPTVGNLIIDKVKSPIIPTYSRTVEVGHAIDKCIRPGSHFFSLENCSIQDQVTQKEKPL